MFDQAIRGGPPTDYVPLILSELESTARISSTVEQGKFAWGNEGEDWAAIQDTYIPNYVRLTWGYMGGIPNGAVPYRHVVSSETFDKVGNVSTIGLEDEDDGDMDHHRMVSSGMKSV
ncbi:hypothetical protein FPCIR_10382 [Fusarium pseudocircinatum]|uniref:Uncharacterized protein n=1 Tax=Fusarium pseudocircinatum TaxID=56676 RepID=A0A8H5KUU8_9HYPO|nr:hypothetical protein FPCIR_10382 [Fusarium pseudocircinatum]